MIRKAASFGMVGVVNVGVDAAVFFLALRYLTDSLIVANILAWLVAVSGSYVMNTYTTFASESGRQLRWRDFARFAASGILGVATNTVVLIAAATVLPIWAAKVLAIGATFAVNFLMSYFVIFPEKKV